MASGPRFAAALPKKATSARTLEGTRDPEAWTSSRRDNDRRCVSQRITHQQCSR